MTFADFSELQRAQQDIVRSCGSADDLLLVRTQNDLATLALYRVALDLCRTVGVVDDAVLAGLDGVDATAASDQLHVVRNIEAEGPGLVCFTSGSSGNAKAILRTPESWRCTYALQRDLLGYGSDACALILGNLAHSMHLYGAMECLDRHTVPVVLKRFTPRAALEHCRSSKAQIVYATPAHLNLILERSHRQPIEPIPHVRHILAGGAKLNEQRLEQLSALFPEAIVSEFFGTTETSYITIKAGDAPHGSVGKACPGVDINICDKDGNSLPAGQEGSVWVRSDMLFERYILGDDRKTRWQDGFLTVGDQGYLDDDGNFFFTARSGSMVTIAGENVFLDHVEAQLASHIARGEAVVMAIPDRLRGQSLIAVTEFPAADREAVLREMRCALGALKAPKSIIHIANWPYLPSGKTDRQRLRRMVSGMS